jgi:hypothetical protein
MIQDWKKRVSIVPGNHDYASMNELETIEKQRTTAGGVPNFQSADIIVRFPYYIHFVGQLLDLDINMLVQNGMNEFRQYQNMKMNFICLSNSSDSSALRNNKVSFNGLKSLLDKAIVGKGYSSIVVSHYSPNYKIDYVNDVYHDKVFTIEKTEVYAPIYKHLCRYMKEIADAMIYERIFPYTLIHKIAWTKYLLMSAKLYLHMHRKLPEEKSEKEPQSNFDFERYEEEKLHQDESEDRKLREGRSAKDRERSEKDRERSEKEPQLIFDFGRLIKYYEEVKLHQDESEGGWEIRVLDSLKRNEEVREILMKVDKAIRISERDQAYFDLCFKKISDMGFHPIYLAGHEHKYREDPFNKDCAFSAPRLWAANPGEKNVKGFYGQIIEIKQNGLEPDVKKLSIEKIIEPPSKILEKSKAFKKQLEEREKKEIAIG